MRRLGDLLDDRIGWRRLAREALGEPVPGGARFAYVFGSVVVVLLAVQILAGIALAFFYSPGTLSAWASVAYLEGSVPAGAFLRATHRWGASALVVALALHLGQTALFGAYRRPREVGWWSGLCLGAIVLAFALTGYLLPWDQRGYWATRVATGIAGSVPLVGPFLRSVALSGSGMGNLTLTRFYALHAVLLPALLLACFALHLASFRRHGVTPPAGADESRVGRFYPDQLWRDGLVALVAVGLVFALALRFGAPLEGPADPAGHAEPRPEWYFRPLYELLKLGGGKGELVLALLVPLLAVAFLVALPILDRAKGRAISGRLAPLGALFGMGAVALALLGRSLWSDAHDPAYRRAEREAMQTGRRALALAEHGVPPEGPLAMLAADPVSRGEALFARRCAGCHAPPSEAARKGPDLTGYLSPAWIAGLLREPDDPRYYGRTRAVHGMDGYGSLGDTKLRLLAEFLSSLGGQPVPSAALPPALAAGKAEFLAAACDACHSLEPGEPGAGPSLSGYGGDPWLDGFLVDPGGDLYFASDNGMPSIGAKLSPEDRKALVAWLRAERGEAPSP